MSILIIDDDQELCALLQRYLEREAFKVTCVHTAPEGENEALSGKYDAVVLDIMLPSGNGLNILQSIRKRSELPIIMLSAKGEESDRINGLEFGADDYLPKPCNPRELCARLRSVLRRGKPVDVAEPVIVLDDLTIDFAQHAAYLSGLKLDLTVTEFNILSVLTREAGKVVEKNKLAEQALQRSLTLYDRSLDMHLSNLRKKIGPSNSGKQRINTVRGIGYIYES